jgi:hypothetical protein
MVAPDAGDEITRRIRSMTMSTSRRPLGKTALALAAAMVVGVMPAEQALAAACIWSPGTGNWGTSTNWDCNAVPGSADSATIGAAKTVTVNTAHSILNLGNAGNVNLDAASLTLMGGGLTTNTGVINVGGASTAALNVNFSHNINNAGGVINVANGSVLNQYGSTLSGGTFSTSGTGALMVFNSNSNFLSGVTLNGTLDLATQGSAREQIINGATLNGAVNIGNFGILGLNSASTSGGNQTINGSGTINLNGANAHLSIDGNGITTLAAGITVRGQGSIGGASFVGGANTLVNQGLILADVNAGWLSITPAANAGGLVNQGTLRASGGATLALLAATNNAGGLIDVQNGSVVHQDSIKVSGGAITTSGTGAFEANSSSVNFLDGVTFTGKLDLTSEANAREQIINGITFNNATINIANGGILGLNSASSVNPSQTISGTATINLNDAAARLSIDGNGSTTLGAGVTVRGQGNIGAAAFVGGDNVLTSNGLISSDVGGGTLNITAPGLSGSFINNGTLQAINGATLQLSTSIENAGQIIAGAGSTVLQNSVTLNGLINASAAGASLKAISSGSNFLDGVNFAGTLDLTSIANAREQIVNGATINGVVNIANGGILSLNSNGTLGGIQSLAGNVSINLNDAAARLAIDGNGSTTLGAGVTVHGQGNIGTAWAAGGDNVLTSNGLISSDVGGGTLSITAPGGSGSFINNSTMQAVNGATLLLSTSIDNAGLILAGAGSTVVQNGVTLNGVINAAGTGVLKAISSGANFLDGVNFTGNLDLTSYANSREQIINGATINGVVNIANGGILGLNSANTVGGNQALSGTVTINLNDANARLSIDGNGSTNLGAGVTVRGQGNIGAAVFVGGANTLTNNGLISADVNSGTLSITTPGNGGSFINHATLQAVNGATLLLSSDIENAGGVISAQNGSAVVQNGFTISGGTIATSGTGVLRAISSGSNFLSNVTLNGTLDMTTVASAREQIINGMTLNGAVNIDSGSILGLNSNSTSGGNQTISGTGVINLDGARLSIDGNGSTTLGAGITVRGSGNIGTAIFVGGTNTLFNNGTILADGGALSITNPGNSGTLAGTGTLQTSGGTLNLAGLTGPITQGKLVMGGAGSALTMGTQNLTITNDYTSAQWGSGNSFNARAGVSGTGKVVAGGDAAQAITGAGVTNGNTANATLTIGNMRVGANTFNYQVANTGGTGPSLRGAIQTNVNGANLTDARLSGVGVTAANYNTGAPGSNTGNLGVTFTAAGAGALAPLSGQVLNLTSNFGNIADQKLNIVLAGGAAAYNAAVGNTTPNPVTVTNQRIGGSNTAALTVSNTAAAGVFSEDLRATFGSNAGNASNTGGIVNGLLAGSSDASTMRVGVDTSAAGARTGTVTLNYQTTGTVNGVSNGLGLAGANAAQTITVNGNVYQVASGLASSPVQVANQRIGGNNMTALIVGNNTTFGTGFIEDLNASVASTSGATAAGSLSGIVAGRNNVQSGAGAILAGVDTSSAGAKSGTVTISYQTAGAVNGVSNGLGTLGVGSQAVTINGNVYQAAAGALQTPALNFGTVQVGQSVSQSLVIRNTASGAAGYVEDLNASFGSATGVSAGLISGSGTLSGILAGANSSGANGAMTVSVNTAAAGLVTGGINVNYETAGKVNGVSNGLGTAAAGSENYGVSGTIQAQANVINQASPQINTPTLTFGAVRVGAAAPSGTVSVTNLATVAPQAALNASIAPTSGPITANGSFNLLNPGATDSTSLVVGLNTGVAGNYTGANAGKATIAFVSDASNVGGCGANCQLNLASQTVTVEGKVYQQAVGTVAPASIDFGVVRVGTGAQTKDITITNTAAVAGLNDTLTANVSGLSGALSGPLSVGNIVAQTSGNATVSLSTAAAGVFNQTVNVALLSHNADLADVSAGGDAQVSVTAQVNNLAHAILGLASGAGSLSGGGNSYTLDFGTLFEGSGSLSSLLFLENEVAGPADNLRGTFDLSALGDFAGSGWGAADLQAMESENGLEVDFSALSLGQYSGKVTFNGYSWNAFNSDYQLGAITLTFLANVIEQGAGDVPEPGTLALLLAAAAAGWMTRKRQAQGRSAA